MNIAGRKLSNGDLAVGAGLIVALIAIFLPWYSASYNVSGIAGIPGYSGSVSTGGFSYWTGWFFFLATLVGIALFALRTFVPTVAIPALPLNDAMTYVSIGAFMVVMAVLWLLLGSGAASVSGPGYSAGASFGLFIGIIAAAAVVVGGFLKRSDPQPATKPLSAYQTPSAPPPPPPSA